MLIFERGSELMLIILSYVATFAQTTTPSSPVTSRNNIYEKTVIVCYMHLFMLGSICTNRAYCQE